MNLSNQKAVSARLLKAGKSKVWFDKDHLTEIKEAITKKDLESLIKKKIIQERPSLGSSRVRARKRLTQRRKGRQQGPGSRKGSPETRLSGKQEWMNLVRGLRSFIKELKEKQLIDNKTYRNLYMKVKGRYFRNKRHVKLYLTENKLFTEKKK